MLESVVVIARTVAYLHSHGVVHRDLKPSNILLNEFGQPCVSDFGLVKLLETDVGPSRSGLIVGTPSYMAPEQAAGRTGEVGPLSDVYSLGAILFEMLTGRPPFRESSPLDTLVQVLERDAPRPRQLNSRVPPELESICLKCLEKSPRARYGSADALADDVERYLRGEEPAALSGGVWRRLRRWARREPALSYRLLAVILVAVNLPLRYYSYPKETGPIRLPLL
jgi:serine/threonine-protein kinase